MTQSVVKEELLIYKLETQNYSDVELVAKSLLSLDKQYKNFVNKNASPNEERPSEKLLIKRVREESARWVKKFGMVI